METGARGSGAGIAESREAASATVRPGVRRGPRRYAARRWPEADHVAVVAGISQARREVRAVGEGQHAAGDRRRRAAGGARSP